MRETRRPGNYPYQTILHTLKFQNFLYSNTVKMGIAIVKYTANKGSCNCFGDRKRYIPAHTAKDTHVIKQQRQLSTIRQKSIIN